MSPGAQVNQSGADALWIERRRVERGMTAPEARKSIARDVRASVGTLENLARGRLKRIDAWLRDNLTALFINELQGEIARLHHELDMARQRGAAPHSEQILAIKTSIAALTTSLNETSAAL